MRRSAAEPHALGVPVERRLGDAEHGALLGDRAAVIVERSNGLAPGFTDAGEIVRGAQVVSSEDEQRPDGA